MCAGGVRSPLAPTMPISGTIGTTLRLRQASKPEKPRARLLARKAMTVRVCGTDKDCPTPLAR